MLLRMIPGLFTPFDLCCVLFPGGSVIKNLPANVGDMGSIPGLGRPPGGGHGNPLQYYGLENPMDRGACFQGGTCISLSVLLK